MMVFFSMLYKHKHKAVNLSGIFGPEDIFLRSFCQVSTLSGVPFCQGRHPPLLLEMKNLPSQDVVGLRFFTFGLVN